MNTPLSHRFSPRCGGAVLTLLGLMCGAIIASAATPWRVRQVLARSLINGFAVEPWTGNTVGPVDRAFLTKAAKAGREEMGLAEIGVSHAEGSEVRSHAHQLLTDYRALNDALTALIRRKGGPVVWPETALPDASQQLAEKSGAAFDREFVRLMARMGNDTQTLFEQMTSESRDADVRDLAASQLPVLRAHRNTVTELMKTFY